MSRRKLFLRGDGLRFVIVDWCRSPLVFAAKKRTLRRLYRHKALFFIEDPHGERNMAGNSVLDSPCGYEYGALHTKAFLAS